MPDEDTPTIARAKLGGRKQNGEADGVLGALEDLGRNRLPLPQTVRVHNATKVVQEAIREREELRQSLIKQYDDNGGGWQDVAEAPDELVNKVAELLTEEVELDLGEPMTLKAGVRNIELSRESYAILEHLGFLDFPDM